MKNKHYVEIINPKTNTSEILESEEPISLENNYERVCSENFDEKLKRKINKKRFDEDKIIDVLAAIVIFAFIVFMWWLVSVPQAPENNKPETTQTVENSVENVEKCVVVEETQPTYTEKEMILTAYCPCVKCCGKSDGITASGTKAKQGRTVAVDPRYIPYGTEIIIDGVTYIAEDCGGAIKGDRIDIFFDDHTSALGFGVKKTNVYIVSNETK